MDAVKTGKLIQTIRTELGMRQEDLASLLHVSRTTISKYERGIGCPDISLLEPLAEALHITVTELMKGEREIKPDPIHDELLRETIQTSNQKYMKQNLISLILTAGTVFGIMLWHGIYGNWIAAEVLVPVFCTYSAYLIWKDNHSNWMVWMIPAGGLVLSLLIGQSTLAELEQERMMSNWKGTFHTNSKEKPYSEYGFVVNDGLTVMFFPDTIAPAGVHDEYVILDYSHVLTEYDKIFGTYQKISDTTIQLDCPVLGNPIAIRQKNGMKLITELDGAASSIDLNYEHDVYFSSADPSAEIIEYRAYVPDKTLYGIVQRADDNETLVQECDEKGENLTGRIIRVPRYAVVQADDPPGIVSYPPDGVKILISNVVPEIGQLITIRYDSLTSEPVPAVLGAYDFQSPYGHY